jgi:hypothetical protein
MRRSAGTSSSTCCASSVPIASGFTWGECRIRASSELSRFVRRVRSLDLPRSLTDSLSTSTASKPAPIPMDSAPHEIGTPLNSPRRQAPSPGTPHLGPNRVDSPSCRLPHRRLRLSGRCHRGWQGGARSAPTRLSRLPPQRCRPPTSRWRDRVVGGRGVRSFSLGVTSMPFPKRSPAR